MMISSEKANKRAAAAVEFAHRHSWAKYPCLAAVSAVYSAEYIRLKASELADRIKASSEASFRPFGGRVLSVFLSGTIAFMAVPFSAASAFAEENAAAEEISEEETAELPKPWTKLPPRNRVASTPEDIAQMITKTGLAEDNDDYDIILNIKTLKKDVTANFSKSPRYLDDVVNAFECYGIETDELNIQPFDVSIYTTREKYALQLSDGYTADITLPIPDEMHSHVDDLKVVRLEDNGSITVLDGNVRGKKVSFSTEHFSVFALVSYRDEADDIESAGENIGSGAGVSASGVTADMSVSTGYNILEEDKRRFRKDKKHRVYRIKRIAKEKDLLLL